MLAKMLITIRLLLKLITLVKYSIEYVYLTKNIFIYQIKVLSLSSIIKETLLLTTKIMSHEKTILKVTYQIGVNIFG